MYSHCINFLFLAVLFATSSVYADDSNVAPSQYSSQELGLSKEAFTNSSWEDLDKPDDVYDSPFAVSLFSAPHGEDEERLLSQTKSIAWYGVGVAGFIALLPEDVSNWDRSDDQLLEKWWDNVKGGPVWDRDMWHINYIGHTYFGGVYYQVARKSGYRQWDAFIYSFLMSTFYWEYGLEAFAEEPSIQDLVVTPVLGWVYGEWAFHKEREIIERGGKVWGSSIIGDTALFFLDPVDRIGLGVNNLLGSEVIKAGTGYIGFRDVPLPNGEVDTQFQVNLNYAIGDGETSPALKRRQSNIGGPGSGDPVDFGMVGLSIGARYVDLDGYWLVENRWAPTISLGVYFTPQFSSRLNYTRADTEGSQNGQEIVYENYSFDFQYYLNSDNVLRPYINAGIGETQIAQDRDSKVFQLNGGLGLHYQFSRNWALLADWCHYYSTSAKTHDDLFSGQLVYFFGRGVR